MIIIDSSLKGVADFKQQNFSNMSKQNSDDL